MCFARVTNHKAAIIALAQLLILMFGVSPLLADADDIEARLGISDPFPNDPINLLRDRFNIYKSANIGVLRADLEWRMLEQSEDVWTDAPNITLLEQAAHEGFHLKLSIGSIQGPPKWYLSSHPSAQLMNGDGLGSYNVISFWYPELHMILEKKDRKLFQYLANRHLLKYVSYIVVPMGAGGEGVYPVPWTTSAPKKTMKFWFYDSNARLGFSVAMHKKYGFIGKANSAWGTSYNSWSEVVIPEPGTVKGKFWSDVLDWYKNVKRSFISWQLDHYKRLVSKFYPKGARPRLILLLPGSHRTEFQNENAISSGEGSEGEKAMVDTEFLLDIAYRAGVDVQYTGMPNPREIEYIMAYQSRLGYSIRTWGENAGNNGDPRDLDEEVVENSLYGQEYIGSNSFSIDHVTPTAQMTRLIDAHRWLAGQWEQAGVQNLELTSVLVAQGTCINGNAQGSVKLCLTYNAKLILTVNEKTVWESASPTEIETCSTNEDPDFTCTAFFQGDGNLVVRRGSQAVWNTGAIGQNCKLILSSKPPYISIADSSGSTRWEPLPSISHFLDSCVPSLKCRAP